MITGDNPLTACHVGTVLEIVRPNTPVLVLTPPNALSSDWHWQSVDDSIVQSAFLDDDRSQAKHLAQLTRDYDLCLTGEGIEALRTKSPRLLHALIPKVKIHARVVPKQKENILVHLKRMGYVTMMCGDGTNDVGALKQAHVGVALLNEAGSPKLDTLMSASTNQNSLGSAAADRAGRPHHGSRPAFRGDDHQSAHARLTSQLATMDAEQDSTLVRLGDASIAAPFTAKMSSPSGGPALPARSFSRDTLILISTAKTPCCLIAPMRTIPPPPGQPLKTLSHARPMPNIFNLYTLLTVTLQFMVHFSVLCTLTQEAEARMPVKDENFIDVHAEFEPSILNTVVYLISTSMQIATIAVNYKGHPFMESLLENKPIVVSLSIATGGVILLALGLFAEPLRLIRLDPQLQKIFFMAVAFDFIASWLVDRVLVFFFGRVRVKSL
ncbi:ATP13A1 protein [Fasciola gigantica]|uniref:ATP13A1 protein n=1 Tax=Fasciola gigantica TaxID=46835 RepID=A0A504YCK6_FASGI|nr:ATP13A1 protein [Fasciola gigantica]